MYSELEKLLDTNGGYLTTKSMLENNISKFKIRKYLTYLKKLIC